MSKRLEIRSITIGELLILFYNIVCKSNHPKRLYCATKYL